MGLMFTGIGLNLLGVFYIFYYVSELSPGHGAGGFIMIVACSWLLSLMGGILIATGKSKLGTILVCIGSVIFVPLGMVAIIGARKAKSPQVEADLDARRQAAFKPIE